jgi:predicted MFS family arabinose efflux permease
MSYRALAGSAPVTFFVLGVFARLPYAITPLGSLLLLQLATGSHTFAGLAAGAQSLAIAVAGLSAGGLAARFGARRLGMTLAMLNALAALLLIAASTTASRPAMLGGAVLVGLTQTHVGLFVRVHWSRTLGRGTTILRTAFSYESAVDELSFVIGPAVAGLFAAVRPGAGPLLGMALLLLGTSLPFAAMYINSAPKRQDATGRLPVRQMAPLVASMATLGAIFGSIQAATTAHATSDSGFLYACLGIGSALAGIAYGWLPQSFRADARYIVFSATLVLGMAVLLPLSPWRPIGILVAGFTIAPYMITLYTLTDMLAPPARLPIAMAAVGAGGPVGTAIGQAVTGTLIDGPGVGAAWLAPAGFACVALLVALVNRLATGGRFRRNSLPHDQ